MRIDALQEKTGWRARTNWLSSARSASLVGLPILSDRQPMCYSVLRVTRSPVNASCSNPVYSSSATPPDETDRKRAGRISHAQTTAVKQIAATHPVMYRRHLMPSLIWSHTHLAHEKGRSLLLLKLFSIRDGQEIRAKFVLPMISDLALAATIPAPGRWP